MTRRYRIAYLIGLQHSGARFLGAVLNAHERAVSVEALSELGDRTKVAQAWSESRGLGGACAYGAERIPDGDFWQSIDREVERRSGLTLGDLDLRSSDPLAFADHNRLFFDCLADTSGANLIVDSSRNLGRLRALLAYTDLPLVPIHLLRDPKGQIHSLRQRGQASLLECAARYRRATLEALRVLRGVEHLRLRYEGLVADPKGTLEGVMTDLGLSYQPAQLDWSTAERHDLGSGQLCCMNGKPGPVDEDWRAQMGVAQRAAITLLTLPATYATRRY